MESRTLAVIAVLAALMPAAPAFAGGRGGNSNVSLMGQDSAAGPRPVSWAGYTGSPTEVSEATRRAETGVTGSAATTAPADTSASTPGASADRPSSPATSK